MPADTVTLSTVTAPSWSLELDLVDRPTPFLMVDLETVRAAYTSLTAALPGFRIHYAMKANPQPEILNDLASCGAGFEVASGAELQTLIDCDIETHDVIFSNPVKAPRDIRMAHDWGVPCYAFDSDSEIVKLALEAPGSAVCVRLATTGSGSRFPLAKRFGVGPHEAIELLKLARNFGLVPHGCTFHVGSQNTDPRSWDKPIEDSAYVMREFERLHGTRLQMLNIGGGFPAQYAERRVPSLAVFGSSISTSLARLPYPVELVTEPGRALVANAGIIASTVIGRRRRDSTAWVHLDVGPYNGLMEANAFLGGERNPISWSGASNGGRTVCTLTGPTCDDGDILQDSVELPTDLGLGDRVYIGTAGAYSTSIAVNFNGFAPPKSYVRSPNGPPPLPQPAVALTQPKREFGLPRLSRESLGLAAVLLSALLWAASANVAESLYASGVGSLQVAGGESVIAAICLLAWRLNRGGRAPKTLSIRQRLLLGTSLALMVITYYGAIEMLEVGSAVVLHYSAPVLVVLWTLLRSRQPPRFKVAASLGLSAIGILLVTQLVVTGFGALNPAGIVVALASAAFLAAYTLLSDAAMRTATPIEVMTETFLWAAPLSVVAFVVGGSPAAFLSASNIAPVLFIGVLGALLGTGLFVWGIGRVHSVKAAIAANLEPVAASGLAWLWFGQVLSPLQGAGALLILGAVALLHDSAA